MRICLQFSDDFGIRELGRPIGEGVVANRKTRLVFLLRIDCGIEFGGFVVVEQRGLDGRWKVVAGRQFRDQIRSMDIMRRSRGRRIRAIKRSA